MRTTVADMGPALLANLLELNDTQSGLLHLAFDYADKERLPLLDLKDLEAVLNWMLEHRKALQTQYGSLSPQSLGAIVRCAGSLGSRLDIDFAMAICSISTAPATWRRPSLPLLAMWQCPMLCSGRFV